MVLVDSRFSAMIRSVSTAITAMALFFATEHICASDLD